MSRANPNTTHDNAGIAAGVFKLVREIRSHHAAYDFLYEDHTALLKRKLGPNMVVRREGTDSSFPIEVVLYDTPIIRYYPDGTFSVDNGGHNTPTTKYRLEAVLPAGWLAFHHKKQLALSVYSSRAYPERESRKLWPLDHSKHIDIATGEIKEV